MRLPLAQALCIMHLMENPNTYSTARSLPIALLRARERVMGPIRALLSDVGITEQQWRVLRVLDESGPQDPTSIAESACLLLPSLTRILQKLEEKDLIDRTPDKVDRRRQVISISAGGSALIAKNLGHSIALLDGLRAQMGPEDYDRLLDLLNALNNVEIDT